MTLVDTCKYASICIKNKLIAYIRQSCLFLIVSLLIFQTHADYFCSTERHIIKQICETTSLLFNSFIHSFIRCYSVS